MRLDVMDLIEGWSGKVVSNKVHIHSSRLYRSY